MIVLGIDPGLAHTGWGVIETRGTQMRARAYGCVTTAASESIDQRLGSIFTEISGVITRYGPSQLAIEKIFFGDNTRSAIATAQARGAAIVACSNAGLTVGEYTPMQIKQAVVGTGSADKRQVIYMVRNILALDHDPRPDHAADALAAAVCHANLARTRSLTHAVDETELAGQQQAQLAADAETARSRTRAASRANAARARGHADPLSATRTSRRSTR